MMINPPEQDDFIKKTHPDFTVVCRHCQSDEVYFDSDFGFAIGGSAFWGGIYFACSKCENKNKIDIHRRRVHMVNDFHIQCDECNSRQVFVVSNVAFVQCRPPSSGSVYLKCQNCKNKVEIWSTYATRQKITY